MTRLRHALRWLAPYRARWLRERDDHARTRTELAALREHFALAVRQRNAARDLAAAVVSAPEWSDEDARFLDTGVWPA